MAHGPAGNVRAWAYVSAGGKILAQRGVLGSRTISGIDGLQLPKRSTAGCAAVASVVDQRFTEATPPGFAIAKVGGYGVGVRPVNLAGQPARLPFVVEVLC